MSETARDLVAKVAADKGTPLCMVIANGCCDGTAPYLYANMTPELHWTLVMEDDLVSVYTGNLGPDVPGMDVLIDARRDLSDSLSLESDYGYRFVVRFVESGNL
ncbi:hypothetical protein AN477_23030 [Alicyclobacillus ferrooxydans]|uniref:DUF779 domain-containing protein n=1 Tax=Alicyclobacillus ferrooxydans TaxID=471514 RepID=A0A0P9GH74_9BACL|nr:hypothetical protein AN477_23030 [Alicyclobacillus ferrooxydans]